MQRDASVGSGGGGRAADGEAGGEWEETSSGMSQAD